MSNIVNPTYTTTLGLLPSGNALLEALRQQQTQRDSGTYGLRTDGTLAALAPGTQGTGRNVQYVFGVEGAPEEAMDRANLTYDLTRLSYPERRFTAGLEVLFADRSTRIIQLSAHGEGGAAPYVMPGLPPALATFRYASRTDRAVEQDQTGSLDWQVLPPEAAGRLVILYTFQVDERPAGPAGAATLSYALASGKAVQRRSRDFLVPALVGGLRPPAVVLNYTWEQGEGAVRCSSSFSLTAHLAADGARVLPGRGQLRLYYNMAENACGIEMLSSEGLDLEGGAELRWRRGDSPAADAEVDEGGGASGQDGGSGTVMYVFIGLGAVGAVGLVSGAAVVYGRRRRPRDLMAPRGPVAFVKPRAHPAWGVERENPLYESQPWGGAEAQGQA
jgi:hypothetical protein